VKYKTFARLRLGIPLTLAAGGVAGVVTTSTDASPKITATQPVRSNTSGASQSASPSAQPAQPAQPVAAKGPTLTGVRANPSELSDTDREVLRLRDRPLSDGTPDGASTKYRSKNGKVVIELRADTAKGASGWDRAKVDLDGDKLIDEKWDFRPGNIVTRKVSTSDDGVNYNDVFRLQNRKWILAKTGEGATISSVAATGSTRSIDATVRELLKSPLTNGVDDGGSLKYRVKSPPAVIELRCDTAKGFKSWNRVKLDLDGDKKVDEKWTVTASGAIERSVSPNDNDTYTEKYELRGSEWVKV
jgi:hypothetical protein